MIASFERFRVPTRRDTKRFPVAEPRRRFGVVVPFRERLRPTPSVLDGEVGNCKYSWDVRMDNQMSPWTAYRRVAWIIH